MILHVSGLRLYGYHGVIPQERAIGAYFYFTLQASVSVSDKALKDDDLAGTVSYADVCRVISAENDCPSQLLEHLAYRILCKLFSSFPTIETASLKIVKENPPIGFSAENIGIELSLNRHDVR